MSGKDITIVSMGASVLTSIQAAENLKKKSINVDLIDLRSLSTFNVSKIFSSVQKTKRLVVVEDGWSNGSISSEIITRVVEKGIKLKKPPQRICWPNSHVPTSHALEKEFYFDLNDISNTCIKLMKS